MQGMHFLFLFFFFVNIMSCEAHRFKLTAYACLLACVKMKCTDKNNQIKSTTLSLSSYQNSLPLTKRANAELRAAAAAAAASLCISSIQKPPHPMMAMSSFSFIWCSAFLLPGSGLRLLRCCCFLGVVVFGLFLCSGVGGGGGVGGCRLRCSSSGGGGGFGGLRGL